MGGLRAVACGAALLLGAGAAADAQEDLRGELERTRAEMRKLQEKVERLEGLVGGDGGAVAKEVEAYLAARPPGSLGNVTAPNSRGLKFSGQVVLWVERFDDVYRPAEPTGDDVNDIARLRTAIQADFDVAEGLKARVEIRDARYYGSEPSTISQLQTTTGGTDLKQGWFEATDLLGSGADLRAGRQVLAYGDQRLVGHLEWHTLGRSFDALRFARKWGDTQVDLFAARTVEGGPWLAGFAPPVADDGDSDLYGLYTATPKGLAGGDLDVYLLGFRSGAAAAGEAGGSGNTFFGTGGLRWSRAGEEWDGGFEGALQRGHLAGDPLSAFALHGHAGYTFADARGKPRIGVEANWASGDRDPGSGERQSFQTLFPTDHPLYGPMNLTTWKNLREIALFLSLQPAERWTLRFECHRFWVDQDADAWYGIQGIPIRPGDPSYSNFLGTEVDLIATHRVSERMRIDVGASQFFDGGFVRDSGPGGDALWLWTQFTVTF
ncbi:MAG: alginate export family protein [Planctomycetaceae bacterium]|nr:alginate export family protein [Planctomycetota bacterium]NUN52495.1 alginate export family protein [Planctomycetaceae bacterium]